VAADNTDHMGQELFTAFRILVVSRTLRVFRVVRG